MFLAFAAGGAAQGDEGSQKHQHDGCDFVFHSDIILLFNGVLITLNIQFNCKSRKKTTIPPDKAGLLITIVSFVSKADKALPKLVT